MILQLGFQMMQSLSGMSRTEFMMAAEHSIIHRFCYHQLSSNTTSVAVIIATKERFTMLNIPLSSSSFSTLSTRLSGLNIQPHRYKNTDRPDDNVYAISIESTGLKRFERGEWHEQK